jgi:LysR family glycine cleavage system transcriptional activator
MARQLPPLNALRAFEAAARHLSFTRAADELNVTQAAVSHQIKALEERLNVTLFRRVGRNILLTDVAQGYLPAVRDAFDRLALATRQVTRQDRGGVLNASVLPSFAAKWLLPRLVSFRTAHPEIDLRVSTSNLVIDFVRDDFDIAIRMGDGRWPGLRTDLILTESFFPVCSPLLIERSPPLAKPEDLAGHTLLHDDDGALWLEWLTMVGARDVDWRRGPGFTDSSLVIQAAVEGQGVALARGALASHDLTNGRLVRPFAQSIPNARAYYLVCPEATADRPKIAVFRQWLTARVAQEQP